MLADSIILSFSIFIETFPYVFRFTSIPQNSPISIGFARFLE